jgi:general stress protein 26
MRWWSMAATRWSDDMGELGRDDLESMREARLEAADRLELLATQRECTFVFAGQDGWPAGVVMNFLHEDDRLWLTAVEGRAQVVALATEPRVSVVVSSAGTALQGRRMVALRGVATVHRDRQVLDHWLDVFAGRWRTEGVAELRRLLDSPNRVVIEVADLRVAVSHDHRRVRTRGPDR